MKLSILKLEKHIEGELKTLHPVLIQHEGRNYLVDCGYEEMFEELKHELKLLGLAMTDLTGAIITHDDYDHLGCLKQMKEANSNLKVFCGALEKESVSGSIKSERLIQAEALLEHMPEESKEWAIQFIQKVQNVQRIPVDQVFADSECLEQELTVVHTPGHTLGHISLFWDTEKTLVAGDALVVENGELDIANPSFTLDLQTAIQSVHKIKRLNPQKIICYHGGVVDCNLDEKLERLVAKYNH